MSYDSLIEGELPEFKFASTNVATNVIDVLVALKFADLLCPMYMGYGEDGSLEIRWIWKKGDWSINVSDRDRYVWDLVIEVNNNAIKDCSFYSFDCRNGISKGMKTYTLDFNHDKEIPLGVIEKINEFQQFYESNT